uniref:Cellulosome enzyme, dockerin type I n=1 Tax=uncultured bacterium contig00040 TaxID=1181528 RepID=A0A806KEP8_9BACT|nr:cellulosome enzyme, dockerin type I [uncultured bacterium contig00040]
MVSIKTAQIIVAATLALALAATLIYFGLKEETVNTGADGDSAYTGSLDGSGGSGDGYDGSDDDGDESGLPAVERKPYDPLAYEAIELKDKRHFSDAPVNVEITFGAEDLGISDYAIYYTTDGTDPVAPDGDSTNAGGGGSGEGGDDINAGGDVKAELSGSTLYRQPFTIPSPETTIQATCLKIKVFYTQNGEERETPTLTHTYFTGKGVFERFDTLVFSVSTDPYNLYDYEYGIFVAGKLRDDYVREHPRLNIDPPAPANYNLRGPESERPVYVEVFEPSGERVVAQGAGLRVNGAWSRATDPKSFRLYARKRYDPIGDSGKFRYEFFAGATTTTGAAAELPLFEFDSLLLRGHGNDFQFAFIRNELTQTLARNAGYPDTSYVAPVSVFLNGEYYACHWMYQVNNASRFQQVYDTFDGDFAILRFGERGLNWWVDVDAGTEADGDDFKRVFNAIVYGDMTNAAEYAAIGERVDLENLAMYYAIEIIIDNRDWPENNLKVWRYNAPSNDAQGGGTPADTEAGGDANGSAATGNDAQGGDATDADAAQRHENLDGRWRFFLFDAEFAWGLYDDIPTNNTLARVLNAPGRSGNGSRSRVFESLMENDSFREMFANAMCDLLSDAFSYNSVRQAMSELWDAQRNELTRAIKELGYQQWSSRQKILDFAMARPALLYGYMDAYYGMTDKFNVTVTSAEGLRIRLNTIPIEGARQVGVNYYRGHSVTLAYVGAEKGVRFAGWLLDDGTVVTGREITLDGDATVVALAERFDVSPVVISEVCAERNNGYAVLTNPTDAPVPTRGLYITDDAGDLQKHALPAATIQPRGELTLVFKSNLNPQMMLDIALPFSAKPGEALVLSDADGNILSVMPVTTR